VAGAAVLAALVGAARSVQAGDPVPAPSARARSVVGLGDSVTAGSNCTCAPFVERFGRLLAARDGRPVTATNLGVPGLTTGSLGQQLDDPEVSASVASADTLLVTIGANDLAALEERWARTGCDVTCRAPSVAAMARGLASDLARIRALGHEGQRVEVTTYWNVFEDGDVADRERGAGFADWSDAVTVAADAAICRTARSFGDTCVDLYAPFLSTDGHRDPTALLSSDGDHPNSAGHDVIARALLAASPP
jgi:lysophospholipase L1-like esterase